jgi:aromatic ring hydroxylase
MEKITKTPEELKLEADAKKAAAEAKKLEADAKKAAKTAKPTLILKNTKGKEVLTTDYFYKGVTPPGFKVTCGSPVEREDLLTVFDKVFKPEDNILFYKQDDKEVYLILVPLKYSTSVSENNNSFNGDFQKHAISFLTEGSVNLDTLRQKLEKIVKFIKYTDR